MGFVRVELLEGLGPIGIKQGVITLGLVHILIYDHYIKVGKSEIRIIADDDLALQVVRRLTRYRHQSMTDKTRLAFLPIIYVAASAEQASLLEGFCCLHVSANHQDLRLDLASDPTRDVEYCHDKCCRI